MSAVHFLSRQAEALEHVLGYRAECPSAGAQPSAALDLFTVALSREAGTPAAEVARAVSDRLGWPVLDHELAEDVARQLGQPVAAVDEVDERGRDWLLECLEAFCLREGLSVGRYFHCLVGLLRGLGERGRCVLVGRGACFILPPQSTLRVRLVGSRDDRIDALARRNHLGRAEAARRLEELDRTRHRFLREHFHADPDCPGCYDLVLNTSQWSPADCADFIVEALAHKAAGRRPAV